MPSSAPAGEEHHLSAARDVKEYVVPLANSLKTRKEVVVQLCTLLSRMLNAFEFGLETETHDHSHSGFSAY